MEVVEYSNEHRELWDDFVRESRNGTLFHTQRFLSYHEPGKFKDNSLLVYDKGDIVSVFPAVLHEDRVLKSHGGSSYGGPVFNFTAGQKVVHDTMNSIEEYAISKGFESIEMRICPRVMHKYPSEDVDYILWYLGYEVVSAELSTAVQLFSIRDEIDIDKCYRNDTWRSVKKANNMGVTIKDSDDWDIFWDILSDNLHYKHRATPTHTLEEINRLRDLCPGEIELTASYYKGELTAGVVTFICNSSTVHTFYIAQDYTYQKTRSLNLVFHELILYYYQQGYKYLNFGISTESGGTAINEGLFRFKEGFGARGTIRRYYKKELV